jgi:hypothetical protein
MSTSVGIAGFACRICRRAFVGIDQMKEVLMGALKLSFGLRRQQSAGHRPEKKREKSVNGS